MSETVVDAQPTELPEIIEHLQEQIDLLTKVLENHQNLFERLRQRGVLIAADEDGDR
ncbi:hypothetical protein [Polymorphospora sp. NPDC050346]|uniref:hypothetical protein n=1 Tax=Polymorphospora sp. NPDC050346 TaxID=3155780 RepID=UPI0033C5E98E